MKNKLFKKFDFKAKQEGKNLVIEGWANKNIVDSANDLMKYDKVDMSRFEKNPIMFFNHDWNKPIGKVVEHKLNEAGLWVKAQISNSSDPFISYVKDLIEDGILKTFSIGFDPKNESKGEGGVNVIDEWALNEISVVTLPCNIGSEFQMAKSLKRKLMRVKGAQVAEYLSQFEFTEEQLVSLVEMTELKQEELGAIFAGDVTPVPENVLEAIATVLELSEEAKKELMDLAIEEAKEPPPEPETEEEDATPEVEVEIEMEEEKDAMQDCIDAKLPKLLDEGMDREQAIAVAISMCQDEMKCHIKQTYDVTLEPELSNPMLDLVKGQLAMLGSVVAELKAINALLQKTLVEQTVTPVQEPVPDVTVNEEAKALRFITECKQKLKSIMED